MSRPRRYWPVEADSFPGWVLLGECVESGCGALDGRWGRSERFSACGHMRLMPGQYPTREAAIRQANIWQRRQALVLGGDRLGPVSA